MLHLDGVCSGYGRVGIINDVTLKVERGEIVSIIGANGAGKSTLINTISGVVPCTAGKITFEGTDITRLPPHKIVNLGITQIPEGRQIIAELTVRENLLLGCYPRYGRLGKTGRKLLLDSVCDRFPILRDRMNQTAGTLSGGQQQMLAVGRALMGEPKLLLTDEPSWGLAPIIVDGVCEVLRELNRGGLTIIMIEQNALVALEMAQRAYILEGGRIAMEGKGSDLLRDDKVRQSYLGI
jgi:branched-chain amino acid transport system ATP-binding protein